MKTIEGLTLTLPLTHTPNPNPNPHPDQVKTIEGIFSGTLSYLFNEYKPGMKFSDVITANPNPNPNLYPYPYP